MFSLLRFGGRQLIGKEHKLPSLYALSANLYGTEITKKEIAAVKKSWKALSKKSPKLAKDFFKALFRKYPKYGVFFKRFGDCPEDILDDERFIKDHGVGNVLISFGKAVAKLDDPCEAALYAREIGKKHIKYCMKPEHFGNARPVLFKAIKNNSCNMDTDTEKGWEKGLKIIFKGLQKGLKS